MFDFITLDGLERLTGFASTPHFLTFIVKELVDNALDKEKVRRIDVKVARDDQSTVVSVTDDGRPLMTRGIIEKIVSFEKAPSSKRGAKRVSRGVLGNALQCCLGISYASWRSGQRPPYTAEISAGGMKWRISLNADLDYVKAAISEIGTASVNDKGATTTLLFRLPNIVEGQKLLLQIIETVAILNPHVAISFQGGTFFSSFASDSRAVADSASDIHQYDGQEFSEFAKSMTDLTVEGFVTNFRGLRNRSYAKKVLEEARVPPRTVISELGEEGLRALFKVMREHCQETKGSQPALGWL